MTALETAKDLYQQELKQSEGKTADVLADGLDEKARILKNISEERKRLSGVVVQAGEEGGGEEEATAGHLEQASRDIRAAVGGTVMTHRAMDDTKAGRAKLSQKGSGEFDGRKVKGRGRVIHVEQLKGVVTHEDEHTYQVMPDADAVDLRGAEMKWDQFLELGAMLRQKQEAPGSIPNLSPAYRDILENHEYLLPIERTRELARKGMFRQFAKEVNALAT